VLPIKSLRGRDRPFPKKTSETQKESLKKKLRVIIHNSNPFPSIIVPAATDLTPTGNRDLASKMPSGQSAAQASVAATAPGELVDSSHTSSLKRSSPQDGAEDGKDDDDGWQTVRHGRAAKKQKKMPKKDSSNYPAITHAPTARLQHKIQVSDLRNLITYILADGPAPQWVAVSHRPSFRKIVAVMVPGLEEAMFDKAVDLSLYDSASGSVHPHVGQAAARNLPPSDDCYPRRLNKDDICRPLQPLADVFSQLWPVRATGNDRIPSMHSPITTMLTVPVSKSKDERDKKGPRPVSQSSSFQGVRTRITEFIATPQEFLQNEFVLHPAMLDDPVARAAFKDEDGWVHTNVACLGDAVVPEAQIQQGSITAGRDIYAIDCEMCKTSETEFSLTRISVISWDGTVIMDELVKPDKPIIDYLTQYSGITPDMLRPVNTSLADIQRRLLDLFTARSVLVGHSLDSDLRALKLTHPFIVDTTIIFPHPAGPGKKHALRWLSQKYLGREIQKGHGTTGGHDSIEDARTCLDLVKKKCEKGKLWATGESDGENLFKRLARAGRAYRSQGGPAATGGIPVGKTTAAVDWGDPRRNLCSEASVVIACKNDADVEDGIKRAVHGDPDGKEVQGGGVDFVWARMRELEALQGWWNRNKITQEDPAGPPSLAELQSLARPVSPAGVGADGEEDVSTTQPLKECLTRLALRLKSIYDSLPPCTAYIVFSGSGDPREMSRLQGQRAQHRKEYNTPGVKWDQISVPWTDTEEQMLRAAVKRAREGIAFLTVK